MKAPDLFEAVASFSALSAAAKRAAAGKHAKPGATAFLANQEKEVLRLERGTAKRPLPAGTLQDHRDLRPEAPGGFCRSVRDRVVHHALCAVVEPLFERGFIFDSYANRKGKGTHRAVARYERFRDRFRHVLRCDIYRFFPAIDHAILKRDLRRRIGCPRTLWLADRIIDASNPQEPVGLYYPGDGLFTPWERRRGLPIGNLTSQFFANVYLDGLDHFCKEVLRARGYLRYVDDFALFHDDAYQLEEWRRRIARYLEGRRLRLHPQKTLVMPSAEPATFLGFVLMPGGRRRLPEDNVRRFRNRLRGLRDRWRARRVARDEVQKRVASWIAHAEHADTWRLRQSIFRDGWFDPSREPGRPPVRACCAAVPGTTNRGTSGRPTATGTPPETVTTTTTTDSVLPARSNAGAGALTGVAGARVSVQGRP